MLLDTSMRAIFSKHMVPKLFLHPHPYFLSQVGPAVAPGPREYLTVLFIKWRSEH